MKLGLGLGVGLQVEAAWVWLPLACSVATERPCNPNRGGQGGAVLSVVSGMPVDSLAYDQTWAKLATGRPSN